MTPQDDDITLFFDKNIGKSIPMALRMLKPPGVGIRFYLEEYPGSGNVHELGDDVWLGEVGENGWFVITQDYNLHRKMNELFALKQFNIGCFYLDGARDTRWSMSLAFIRAFDRIVEAARNTPRPFLYRVRKNGTLTEIELP